MLRQTSRSKFEKKTFREIVVWVTIAAIKPIILQTSLTIPQQLAKIREIVILATTKANLTKELTFTERVASQASAQKVVIQTPFEHPLQEKSQHPNQFQMLLNPLRKSSTIA